jgi:alkyl sulfatase BDS1-like metallo-beta-lactamase superfamily hydrolase
VLNHLVFADPTNHEARELQADTLVQLGYQSESATFRNAYLMGAQELRNGTLPRTPARRNAYLVAMSVDQILDSMAVRLKAEEVGGLSVTLNLDLTDVGERWVLGLAHRALHMIPGRHDPAAAVTLTLSKRVLLEAAEGTRSLADAVAAGDAQADGDLAAAGLVFDHLDVFLTNFALVEP